MVLRFCSQSSKKEINRGIWKRLLTLTGLCAALDAAYDTFIAWTNDTSKGFSDILQRARLLIQDFEEMMALEGHTNLIYAIFRDKSRWGFIETTEHVFATKQSTSPLGEIETPEQIEARKQQFLDVPVDD